jgi:DNA invertase Pin-like site-specific DNA recombinase
VTRKYKTKSTVFTRVNAVEDSVQILNMVQEKMTMRLFEYHRVSTLKQKLELTVETQKRIIETEVEHQGYEIVKVYEDLAYSGKKVSRPQYEQMLEDIKSREDVDGIIVADLSRFGRGGIRTASDVVDLNDIGKVLIAPRSNFDTRTKDGKISLTVIALLDDIAHGDLVERLSIGRQLYVEAGGKLGAPMKTIPQGELEMMLMGGASYNSLADFYRDNEIKGRPYDRKTIARIAKEYEIEHLNRHLGKGIKKD